VETEAPVVVRFHLAEREYVEAVQQMLRPRLLLMWLLGFFGLIFGIADGFYLIITGCGFLVVALPLIFFLAPRLQWRNDTAKLIGPYEYFVDHQPIAINTPTLQAEFAWPHFSEIIETKNIYLLKRGQAFNLIPKRAFFPATDQDRFQSLISRKRAERGWV
jgi:hypothetical protein